MEQDRYERFINSMFKAANTELYDFTEKSQNVWDIITYTLTRTQSMFKWEGLPETIPERMLELYLQINGYAGFYQYYGDLYVYRGALGGEPDEYYMPTIFTIANPAQNLNVNAKIGETCAVMKNDTFYKGLLPLIRKYASAMAENELSIRIASINSRIIDLITATDDRSKASAEKYIEDVEKGKLGVIASSEFMEGVKTQPYGSTSNSNTITNLIELEQYLKASLFNELGLNANYNMKRESINAGESQLNNDALLPLIDTMLKCRQEGAEMVNRMFNTNISVSLASSWEDNQIEIEQEHGEQEQEQQEGGENNE